MNSRFVYLSILAAGFALTACTRSATTPPPPTPTFDVMITQPAVGDPNTTYPPPIETLDPMLAEATRLAVEATQNASGQVGGEIPTASAGSPSDNQSGAAQPTATPIVAAPPGVNPTAALTVAPPPVGAQPTAAAPAASCTSPYTVQAGEWIYQIGRKCGLDPRAIIAANLSINPSRLAVGQVINLPGAAPAPQPTVAPQPTAAPTAVACTGTYTVKPGDTFFRIAFNCNLTVAQLSATNPGVNIYLIRPGQVIKFP